MTYEYIVMCNYLLDCASMWTQGQHAIKSGSPDAPKEPYGLGFLGRRVLD